MKKIILIAMIVLLVGCDMIQPSQKVPELPEIFKGTAGINAKFHPVSIKEMLMCQEGKILLDLQNNGAYDSDLVYHLILEDQVLRVQDEEPFGEGSMEGRSTYSPVGEIVQGEFSVKNNELPSQMQSYTTPIIFEWCYEYMTYASVPVCIDPDVQNLIKNKPCRVQTVALSGGQGAPVAVTRVEPKMVPEGDKVKTMVTIYLKNLGTGRVVAVEGYDAACFGESSDDARELLALVDISVELMNVPLTCSPERARLLPNEETKVICSDNTEFGLTGGTFSSVLSIELEYGYMDTISQLITISRLPTQKSCS